VVKRLPNGEKMRAMNAVKTVVWIALFAGMSVAESGGSGTFADKRDGTTYKTVAIGGRTWMAENLNYETGKSWCYDKKESNCNKYGRLYDWKTAMKACHSGWHLPSRAEWDALVTAVGGNPGAGTKLKSTAGWNNRSIGTSGNGTNEYGFSALPGGYRNSDGGFNDVGDYGSWWTATEGNANDAYGRFMNYDDDGVYSGYDYKSSARSVRCVGD
jgi:uncharacterized protein (TIGR02145 family)